MSARFKKQKKREQAPASQIFPDAIRKSRNRWFATAISLALLGCWGLIAWLTGLPLGGEIQADPFNLDADASRASKFVNVFICTIPHPTLANMSVVPTGLAGAFSPRPVPAAFVNAPQSAMNYIRTPQTAPSRTSDEGTRHPVLLAGIPEQFLVANQPTNPGIGAQQQAPVLKKEAGDPRAPNEEAPPPDTHPPKFKFPSKQVPD